MGAQAKKTQEQLSEIVRLKKRAAENEYQAATRNLQELDRLIVQTQKGIEAAGDEAGPTSGAEMSTAFAFVQKQVAELNNLSTQRPMLLTELEAARDKLKNIIVSETVLNRQP